MDKLKTIKPKLEKKKGVVRDKVKEETCEVIDGCRDPMFVGIDPSFHSTGLIVLDQDANIIEQKHFSSVVGTSKKGGILDQIEECLIEYERQIDFVSKILKLKGVCIEGPAYNSTGQRALQMGALHYYTRLFLFKNNIDFKVVAPTSLKKFIFHGHAKKDLILLKVYKRWGVEFEIDDLADAYGLARMALEEYTNEQAG
jgi:Holliday junction resolvasome RuvABC endonuclease subunit